MSLGESTSFALTEEGQIFGCGSGLVDFTGQGKQSIKEPILLNIPGVKAVKEVSVGPKHAALVDTDGKVLVWGRNGSWLQGGGQLGLGHREAVTQPTLVKFLSEDLAAKVASVQCGDRHTLFLLEDGDLLASGVGEYGRLGTGDTTDSLLPTPVNLELLPEGDIVQGISAGLDHSLAVTQQGKVLSWGRNQSGQLGQADSYMDMYSMEDLPRPVEIPGLSKDDQVVSVVAGNARSVCLSRKGDVWIWGARLSHQPAKLDRDTFFQGQRVVKTVLGGDSSRSAIFFLLESGALFVQGDMSSDLLGRSDLGRMGKISIPEPIPAFKGMKVVDIFAGCGQHVFARVAIQS